MSEERKGRSLKEYAAITARGICMGAADVVPGVSGGTMALILGIYEELILSIRSFDGHAIALVYKRDWRGALNHVRWPFLSALLLGILGAIASLSRGISWLLENEVVLLWSFFFGLVLASVYTVGTRIPKWDARKVGIAVLSAVGAYILVGNGDTPMCHHPQYNFDDEAIPAGCSYWATLVETAMPAS